MEEHEAERIGHFTFDIKSLGFNSWLQSYTHTDIVVLAEFEFHTASGHPAISSTWCTDPKLDQ